MADLTRRDSMWFSIPGGSCHVGSKVGCGGCCGGVGGTEGVTEDSSAVVIVVGVCFLDVNTAFPQ